MKKASPIVIALLCLLLFAGGSFFAVNGAAARSAVKSRTQALHTTVQSRAAQLNNMLELHFVPLETLARYIALQGGFDSARDSALLGSAAGDGGLQLLGYAQMNGDAASYSGAALGNFSDAAWFQRASTGWNKRTVQYLSAGPLEMPCVLFAVPLSTDGTVSGVLFAAQSVPDFQSIAFPGPDDGIPCFLADENGVVFAADTTALPFLGQSLSDLFPDQASALAKEGALTDKDGHASLITTISASGWRLVSTDTAPPSFPALQTLAILLTLGCTAVLLYILYVHRRRREQADDAAGVLNRRLLEAYTILRGMDSAVYEWDASTRAITSSTFLADILGYPLPTSWFTDAKERLALHPEVDFKALMDAKGSVELTGEAARADIQVQTPHRGLRQIRVTMNPNRDETGLLLSIYGTVADVTDTQNEVMRTVQEHERLYTAVATLVPAVFSLNLTQGRYSALSRKPLSRAASVPAEGTLEDLLAAARKNIPGEDADAFAWTFSRQRQLAAFAAGRTQLELEHRQIGDDGAEHWVLTQAVRVESSYGDDVCSVLMARDIDDQKKYQTLLQKTYDLTLENMPGYVGKWLFTSDDIILIDANRKYLDFLRVPPGEKGLPRPMSDDTSPSERDALFKSLSNAADARLPVFFTRRARRQDGTLCWIQVQASPFEMQEAGIVYYGTVTDVTDLVRAQELLRISREEYRIAASLSDSVLVRYDIAQKSFSALSADNDGLLSPEGANDVPEGAIEKGLVLPRSADDMRRLFKAINAGEECSPVTIGLLDIHGKTRWAEVRSSITRDDDGVPATAILSFADKTPLRQAQEIFNISSTFINYGRGNRKLIVANLTTDHIEYESDGPWMALTRFVGSKGLAEAAKLAISLYVTADDTDACLHFFDPGRFTAGKADSRTEESFDFRTRNSEGVMRWVNAQTRLAKDADTGDTRVYIVFADVHEQKMAELELLRRDRSDTLTGLMSRESFVSAVSALGAVSEKESGFTAFVTIHLDDFSAVNLALGKEGGDRVLQQAARIIRSCLREGDLISRFEGDAFTVLLPQMPSVDLIDSRCRRICSQLHFIVEEQTITASLGVALFPDDASSFEGLLRRAAEAVAFAQSLGGGCCARRKDGVLKLMDFSEGETAALADPDQSGTTLSQDAPKGGAETGRPRGRIFARTFGFFDLFVDGEPVHFASAKEKELLAILVDRNGGTLTSEEAVGLLWEDEPCGERQLSRYRKLAMRLKNTLQAAGAEEILVVNRGVRNIDVTRLDCDYFRFLAGDEEFRRLFYEQYMSNYSWAEDTAATLAHLSGRDSQG